MGDVTPPLQASAIASSTARPHTAVRSSSHLRTGHARGPQKLTRAGRATAAATRAVDRSRPAKVDRASPTTICIPSAHTHSGVLCPPAMRALCFTSLGSSYTYTECVIIPLYPKCIQLQSAEILLAHALSTCPTRTHLPFVCNLIPLHPPDAADARLAPAATPVVNGWSTPRVKTARLRPDLVKIFKNAPRRIFEDQDPPSGQNGQNSQKKSQLAPMVKTVKTTAIPTPVPVKTVQTASPHEAGDGAAF